MKTAVRQKKLLYKRMLNLDNEEARQYIEAKAEAEKVVKKALTRWIDELMKKNLRKSFQQLQKIHGSPIKNRQWPLWSVQRLDQPLINV